ncbi:RDD family protein [Salipaludibacillus agaradhaerens]|uniref:RDD family protein n=1 Tax=Salipaludibacillus agaradhaerens TaxID=76935 RepID=UPI000997C553|nr:RDD family protein [Salipaludibacillus agaradhaerens]
MSEDIHNEEPIENQDINSSDTAEEITILYAGFWMRFWAYAVDSIVVWSINGVLFVPLMALTGVANVTWGTIALAAIVVSIVSFVYFSIMTKMLGQTLGKLIFGIKVYSYDKEELTWLDVIFREVVGRYLHQALPILFLLYTIVAFSPEKRGVHDRLGNTFVGLEPRRSKKMIVHHHPTQEPLT